MDHTGSMLQAEVAKCPASAMSSNVPLLAMAALCCNKKCVNNLGWKNKHESPAASYKARRQQRRAHLQHVQC